MTTAWNDEDVFSERSAWWGRLAALAVGLVVLGGVGYGLRAWLGEGNGNSGKTAATSLATAHMGQIVSSLTTTGTAASNQSSKVAFLTSGQVTSISAVLGQQVKVGDELARLNPATTQRTVDNARASLSVAEIKLAQLQAPATASDIAAAQQSISSAQGQVASAQMALANLLAGPTAADLATAQSSVIQAENSLQSATNGIATAWASLLNAQRNYCQTAGAVILPCNEFDLPLNSLVIHDLSEWIATPSAPASQVSSAISAASSFLAANTGYLNAKSAVGPAQQSLEVAQAKLKTLTDPPAADAVALAQTSLAGAQAGLTAALARAAALSDGPTATDLALTLESVRQARVTYEEALDALDGVVLRAPFGGTVGGISINTGDQVAAGTQAITLTNPDSVRVEITVSEANFAALKAGQFGVATFDSMPGQVYLLRVSGVSIVPTTSQGTVTYPAQAQILSAEDFAASAASMQPYGEALSALVARAVANAASAGETVAGAENAASANQASGLAYLANFVGKTLPAAGMNANLTIIESVGENLLLVPSAAVRRSGAQNIVIVAKDDGTQEQRQVVTAGTDNTNTAIASGLSEGEVVVVGGTVANAPTSSATQGTGPGGPPPDGGMGPPPG